MFKNLLFALLFSAVITVGAEAHAPVRTMEVRYVEDAPQPASFTMTYKTGIMELHVTLMTKSGEVALDILNFAGPGEYELSDGSTAEAKIITTRGVFETSAEIGGSVRITEFDIHKGLVSGNISFRATDGADIMRIAPTIFRARK